MASSARIDELRKKFDENPRRYFAPLANEYRKSGDPEQAIFICQEYLPQQPGHMSGHIVYGQALFELSRFDEARAVFETALSLDPENLIALRHLGDIARHAGDTPSARGWYQRVLEADPRNEEIAQVMLTLLSTSEGDVAIVETAPPSEDNTPTLVIEAVRLPTPAQSAGSISELLGYSSIDLGPELASLAERHAPLDEPPPIPPSAELAPLDTAAQETAPEEVALSAPVSTWGEAPPPSADDDLLDLEDFSVGGVALSSMGALPPAFEPTEAPAGASSSLDEELAGFDATSHESAAPVETPRADSDDLGFDLGHEDGPFEADPFAIAAQPQAPSSDAPAAEAPIELASDMELGLIDDGDSATTFSESTREQLADLETFGESIKGADEAQPSVMEVETFFAGMAREDEPLVGGISRELEPLIEPRPEVEPFESHRTETPMAAMELIESRRDETPVAPLEPLEPIEPLRGESPSSAYPAIDEPLRPAEMAAAPAAEPSIPVDAEPPALTWTPPETPIEVSTPAPAEEFITETMAELYLEQGHLEAAVDIYQRLVAQHPDDAQLAERLHAVEATLRGEPASAPKPAVSSGPTIREFLAGLLNFVGVEPAPSADAEPYSAVDTPVATSRGATPSYDLPAVDSVFVLEQETHVIETPLQASIDEDFGPPSEASFASEPSVDFLDEMDLDPPLSEEPSASPPVSAFDIPLSQLASLRRETPGSSATVSGSIDALFSGAGASPSDTNAASTLSQAFATEAVPEPTPTPLQGVPAHAATSELSLDHVFKTTQARRQDAESGFSFDQFFADELGDSASKGGADSGSSAGKGGAPSDDIAQFNNWLNGLKKT